MASKVLVVGSGAIGLRTALELLHQRVRVSLVSPRHPLHPSTCSMGAGGLWMPFHCDDSRTDRWSLETLSDLIALASSSNSSTGDDSVLSSKPLVEILPAVAFQRDGQSQIPGWATADDANSQSLAFQNLSLDELYEEGKLQHFRLPRKECMKEAGYSHAWFFKTPIIDAPKMLMHMLDEINANQYLDRIDVETNKSYATIEEMIEEAKALGCDGIVNCTGMGSKQVCNDESLVGARGVLLHYDRYSCAWREDEQMENISLEARKGGTMKDSVILIEEPPFGTETTPCYMIPRGAIIAVGGTCLEGDEERSIRKSERKTVIENARTMGINTDISQPVGEWVGFRPCRPTCRLELDEDVTISSSGSSGVRVVHSYGYGGSGWTVFAGVAKEAALLLR